MPRTLADLMNRLPNKTKNWGIKPRIINSAFPF